MAKGKKEIKPTKKITEKDVAKVRDEKEVEKQLRDREKEIKKLQAELTAIKVNEGGSKMITESKGGRQGITVMTKEASEQVDLNSQAAKTTFNRRYKNAVTTTKK